MPSDPTQLDPRPCPVQMTLDHAENDISQAIYAATELLEHLEGAGLVRGNGHHMRQKIAEQAVLLLRERWVNETERGS